jgi:hypothetical protein
MGCKECLFNKSLTLLSWVQIPALTCISSGLNNLPNFSVLLFYHASCPNEDDNFLRDSFENIQFNNPCKDVNTVPDT